MDPTLGLTAPNRGRVTSGFESRESREDWSGLARVVTRGSRQVDLICGNPDLGSVLKAELQERLSVWVWICEREDVRGTRLRLAPSAGFVRLVRSLKGPSVVALISRCDLVHRLASIAVLIHGRERIGYLPVSPANLRDIHRMRRLTRTVVADYAEVSAARRCISADVAPLPIISSISLTSVAAALTRLDTSERAQSYASGTAERSLQVGVQQP